MAREARGGEPGAQRSGRGACRSREGAGLLGGGVLGGLSTSGLVAQKVVQAWGMGVGAG